MTPISIRLLWHKQAQFAGYLLAEELGLARDRGIEIRCEGVDFGCKHVAAILTGAADMAVASPAHILESADPGALSWLLTIQQRSPMVYPARRSDGIERLADLAGRRAAVWPGGEDLELRWMLRRAGLPEGAVGRLEVADTIPPFLAGEAATAQATSYHELHRVKAGVAADDLVVFSAAASGCALIKDGLVAGASLCDSRPETVQAVVDAVLEGWAIAFADPERAVAACLRARPDMAAEEHRAQLEEIRSLSLSGATTVQDLGYPNPDHLDRAAQALFEVEGRRSAVAGIRDARFWDSAPRALRRRDLVRDAAS